MTISTTSKYDEQPGYGEYTIHPTANLFPLMDPDTWERTKTSIRANGLKVPIVIRKGTKEIIDGRNRFLICKELGVTPAFEEYDGTEVEIIYHIMLLNADRRHLTQTQLGFAIMGVVPQLEAAEKEAARERQRQAGGSELVDTKAKQWLEAEVPQPTDTTPQQRAPQTRDIVAKKLGVAEHTLRRVKEVNQHPEIAAQVQRGELSLHAAFKAVHVPKPKDAKPKNVVSLRKVRTVSIPPRPAPDVAALSRTHDMWMGSTLANWFRNGEIPDEWRAERLPRMVDTKALFLTLWHSVPQEWRDAALSGEQPLSAAEVVSDLASMRRMGLGQD